MVASMDIRNKLNRKQMSRHLQSRNVRDRSIEEEHVRHDLRSRLSRPNDW